ncbi:carbohydrate porin [Rhodoferax sp. UBA5149]|uniref:carbohydrate porin n=1 Tax=Rhodoferax sp. UBA5149 TaxID=1947379 RepID=UPI0025D33BFE|nr:carbohydrate porin [Rhodoferax sp. UBA5149]
MKTTYKIGLVAAAAALCAGSAFAVDVGGFEFHGYSRGGPVLSYDDNVKGGLALGGDLQKYRLGNEGDNGIEVDLIKNFEAGGMKWKVQYMPAKWNNGAIGTEQAFVEMSGLSFAPEAKIWAGQRRLRIQDVHIVDNFLMNYGDNQGAGVTDIPIGSAKLGVGVFSGDKFDSAMPVGVKATRINADVSDISTNPGGKLRVLLTAVNGTGLVGGNSGSGISVSHNQADFLVKGMSNVLFLQTSTGHARIDGEFQSIDGVSAGQKATRIADSLNWQLGAFGGQALLGYQTSQDDVSGVTTKDTSVGGRLSYAFSTNFKLLAEAGATRRSVDGQPDQMLNKFTIAPTVSVGSDFWSRPEIRFYVTKANWNDAAALANAATFGAGGKTSRTLVGVQYEIWW